MAVSGLKLKTLPAITVTTAGTSVPIYASRLMVYSASVQSLNTNTGNQYVGDETVASTNGARIAAGDSIDIDPPEIRGLDQFDISQVYVDSSTNGAEFRIIAWIRE